jgi:hypothetical protein
MATKHLFRFIDLELEKWAASPNRKPLLLRGARQVGKTTAVRKLSEKFDIYIEINFEEHRDVHEFFNMNLTPSEIIENISLYYNTPIIESKTLIFFDEIQNCKGAMLSLRFFYEKLPNLHIVAAGSLLEFALQTIPSFGVGRIRSIFMHPLSFDEFLLALGEESLMKQKQKSGIGNPVNSVLHEKLIRHLKKFIILGGMPEVVRKYVEGENIVECQRVLDDLLLSYVDDFAKYKEHVPANRINTIFVSVSQQLGGKFVFSRSSQELNHYQAKMALDLLIKAGLVIPVTNCLANGIPLGAQVKPNYRKMLLLDTGLVLRLARLDIKSIITSSDTEFINKGNIAELFVGLEILKAESPYERNELYYWQREAINSNAEVDYLVQKDNKILPIEVKSGTKGSMQSLFLFLKEKHVEKGIRISLENYSTYQNIDVIPMYAVGDLIRS